MPPKPIFESSRAQSTAVAVTTGLILLGSTGLAYLQAGTGSAYAHDGLAHRQTQPDTPSRSGKLLLDLPNDWISQGDDPNSLLLIDPDRPTRRVSIITARLNNPTPPVQVLRSFITRLPDPSARRTMRPASAPFEFSSIDGEFRGAEFIGFSGEDDAQAGQHLFACLTNDGRRYWLIHLSDIPGPDDDPARSLRENARLLREIYQSAHFKYE